MFTAIDCGHLSVPLNGDVDYQETVFLSMASYTCDSGYLLTGEKKQTCEADGTWSGEPPVCSGMYKLMTCRCYCIHDIIMHDIIMQLLTVDHWMHQNMALWTFL